MGLYKTVGERLSLHPFCAHNQVCNHLSTAFLQNVVTNKKSIVMKLLSWGPGLLRRIMDKDPTNLCALVLSVNVNV